MLGSPHVSACQDCGSRLRFTLQATDTNGDSEYNLDLVTVTGNCKPGRITSTVTDLVVPAKGLAIQIQRTYGSLNASTIGDFG